MPQDIKPPAVPDTLTVIIIDREPTMAAIIHETNGARTNGERCRSR